MKKKLLLLVLLITTFVSCSSSDDNSLSDPITNIEVNIVNQEILVGKDYQFSVNHYPSHLPTPIYIWKSTNADVAIISEKGIMKPKKIGETIIIVTTYGTNVIDSINVNVVGVYNGGGSPANPNPKPTTGTCGARTKDGTPCKRKVAGGGRCWQHK